jgi:tRNA pseudouridine55 synthase
VTLAGLAVVDKPAGITSHGVVARIRKITGTRKVGHAGTLDPMATGVLVVGIDKATRLLGQLQLADKTYDATIRLGVATNTDDADGEVVATASTASVDDATIRSTLAELVGDIEQVPSAVSAIKVDGQRAYKLVREGHDVELAARPVHIERIDVHGVRREEQTVDLDVTVECSTGTYIRAIARDLGAALGVGGHLVSLRRTSVGPFGLADTTGPFDEVEDVAGLGIVSMGEVARRVFPHIEIDEDAAASVSHGRSLQLTLPEPHDPVALLDMQGDLVALYRQSGPVAVPIAVLV